MPARTKLEVEYLQNKRSGVYIAFVKEVYVDSGRTKAIQSRLTATDLIDLQAQVKGYVEAASRGYITYSPSKETQQ